MRCSSGSKIQKTLISQILVFKMIRSGFYQTNQEQNNSPELVNLLLIIYSIKMTQFLSTASSPDHSWPPFRFSTLEVRTWGGNIAQSGRTKHISTWTRIVPCAHWGADLFIKNIGKTQEIIGTHRKIQEHIERYRTTLGNRWFFLF